MISSVSSRFIHSVCAGAALWLAVLTAQAITPEQLQQAQTAGEKLTVIDLRNESLYQKDHIPGAINVPEHIIATKRLPPVGRVVAYCDGLGTADTAACVTALNAKAGIQAEALEGGFAAWKTFTTVSTGSGAISQSPEAPAITFEQLEKTAGQDVMLLDVRTKAPTARRRGEPDPLAQFQSQKLPKALSTRTAKSALDAVKGSEGKFTRAPSLIVVVDDDFATAEATAKQIKASGYHRVVVLAGGEEMIAREGRSGKSRTGSSTITLDPTRKPVAPATTPNK
jgi:rhodanese-related sulfurtransferase